MKKILLAILLVMVTSYGFSQVAVRVKSSHCAKINTAPSDAKNVVYARIEGNDTILIVYLPEVDIDLMNRYYEITETRQGRRLVNNVRKVFP